MSSRIWRTLAVVVLATGAAALVRGAGESKAQYKAKDGSRVVIVTTWKAIEGAGNESMVEFYSPQNQSLCSLDFSSKDGEHGFTVGKASWTPDENYFVFSVGSSGGHQPWHSPTVFYISHDRTIHSLDRYTSSAGISQSNFSLKAPNVVFTEVWEGQSVPARFDLDTLKDAKPDKGRSLHCTGGKPFRVDPYDLQNHE